ncbi:putative TetR family transcriptional regulator [Oscillibacter valericigenes Sjm18-20]|nr:putative TetR family transcriptional regulator [Oscillibacter valericigenes Sjm18-20]
MAEWLTARKKQALEMRIHIQTVALDLFDREGFENMSVDEIVQAAGCSIGDIYHYFKGKDELAL